MSKWELEKDNLIKFIKEDKLSYEEIGRKYKCTGSNIKKVAKRLNIELDVRRNINSSETFNKDNRKEKYCLNCNSDISHKPENKYCSKECEGEYKSNTYYKYFLDNPNEFQRLNEKINITSSEIAELNNEFKNQVQQGFFNTPLKLIEWYPLRINEINGMPCIHASYKRQLKDQPFVIVDLYRFLNYDRIISLTISYRISEKEYWSSILNNTLKSFRITKIRLVFQLHNRPDVGTHFNAHYLCNG